MRIAHESATQKALFDCLLRRFDAHSGNLHGANKRHCDLASTADPRCIAQIRGGIDLDFDQISST